MYIPDRRIYRKGGGSELGSGAHGHDDGDAAQNAGGCIFSGDRVCISCIYFAVHTVCGGGIHCEEGAWTPVGAVCRGVPGRCGVDGCIAHKAYFEFVYIV